MIAHRVTLISKVNPLKYLMTRPMLTGRLARWAIILTEFDIVYAPQKAIRGQAMADAAHHTYFYSKKKISMDGIARSPFHLYLSRLSFFLNKAECDDRSLYYGFSVYT